MLEGIREDVTRILSTSELRFQQPADFALPELPDFLTGHIDALSGAGDAGGRMAGADAMLGALGAGASAAALPQRGVDPYAGSGISRNAPCPCGSGEKYKHCHGAAA